jgi:hypothetical protein
VKEMINLENNNVNKYIFIAVLLLSAVCASFLHAEERIAPQDLQYEDTFTFKHKKTYAVDPWIWGYTKEFAERFHMPQQWVEPELKGALAVAFRVTNIGTTMCGYGGKEDNCWPPMGCQMDIYYDNKIDLGWGRPDIKQDFFMRGVFSFDSLHVLFPQKYRDYITDDLRNSGVFFDSAPILYAELVENPSQNDYARLIDAQYYNREYQPGVGVISFAFCPDRKGSANAYFYDQKSFFESIRLKKKSIRKPLHTIEIPESFRNRARIVYNRDSKSNSDVLDRIKRQFLESKGVTASPAIPDNNTQKP